MVEKYIDDTRYPDFEGELTRDRLLEALRIDLLGPEDPNEQLTQSPSTRYLIGMLSPGGTRVQAYEDDSIATTADDDDGGTGGSGLQNGSLQPSSIGLSFLVGEEQKNLEVHLEWGEYHQDEIEMPAIRAEDSESLDVEDAPVESDEKVDTKKVWTRTPVSTELTIESDKSGHLEVGADVYLDHYSRPYEGARVISLFLRNGRATAPDGSSAVTDNVYQPRITVMASPSGFKARNLKRDRPDSDPDLASADLIYRNRLEYAVGHGVSAGWSEPDPVSKSVDRVFTEIIPVTEVDQVKGPDGLDIDMDLLADIDSIDRLDSTLIPLVNAYASWIEETKSKISEVEPPHDIVAGEHMRRADICLERIRAGIDLLKSDSLALEAFRFANRAMAMQRRASVRSLSVRRGEPVPPDISARWRPFQLAFILQTIQGIVDPTHAERSTVDLLWYPTGGGKTEAYLGLTAFTIALRRLWGVRNGLDYGLGSAVLMRYTLRLLTIQQFQRASALMCAAELIRRDDPVRWGEEPITIGLWVGESVTPNDFAESKKALETLQTGGRIYRSSPYQIANCPWCGESIPETNYIGDKELTRTLIKCKNLDCEFSGSKSKFGIPALVVDEEIYANPPSLLLATVDKFARLPWNRKTGWLFGRASHRCERHGFVDSDHPKSHRETRGFRASVTVPVITPPASFDLVIQDELHLISGPMGSLVGAYEAVVDRLSEKSVTPGEDARVGPKVIASTATVRRARDQIRSLFARESAIFPPPGIDAENSFFAIKDTDRPGRLYVGVFGPGRSIKTTLVRTYASMLTRAKYEFEKEKNEVNDSYMTLIGYFNSIRELGGAVRLIADDVPARIRVLRNRDFGPQRRYLIDEELTSRRQSHQISRTLTGLERNFIESNPERRPYDVLLASNMLSVGVDIDRLGLMVMSAQPKTTAEYIQASSRIGRQYPGLVIQVYNWIRPRDISHYERFRNYHETFYRHVEATSVTPFSERAQDRALPGVLSAMVRHSVPGMDQNRDAGRLDKSSAEVLEIIEQLASRSARASGRGDSMRHATGERVRQLVDEWDRVTEGGKADVAYSSWGASDHQILLSDMSESTKKGLWGVSNSLREVETEVDVVLIDGYISEDADGD